MLLVGLVVEHVLTEFAVNGVRPPVRLRPLVGFSLLGTALWAVWLMIAERIGGLAVLAVALLVEHGFGVRFSRRA